MGRHCLFFRHNIMILQQKRIQTKLCNAVVKNCTKNRDELGDKREKLELLIL